MNQIKMSKKAINPGILRRDITKPNNYISDITNNFDVFRLFKLLISKRELAVTFRTVRKIKAKLKRS